MHSVDKLMRTPAEQLCSQIKWNWRLFAEDVSSVGFSVAPATNENILFPFCTIKRQAHPSLVIFHISISQTLVILRITTFGVGYIY